MWVFREPLPRSVKPWVRLAILMLGLVILSMLSYAITGTLFPADSGQANIFQSGLLLVILGSLFLEDKFTRPADVVVNGLTGMISLLTVLGAGAGSSWTLVFGYCGAVFLMAVFSIALGIPGEVYGLRARISHVLYRVSTTFGSSRILFTVVFLHAVLSFYGLQSRRTAVLILFWGGYVALWPLRVPHLLQALLTRGARPPDRCGSILRMDSPDIVRVELRPGAEWDSESLIVACTGDGQSRILLPLFGQAQDECLVGTGLCLGSPERVVPSVRRGGVYVVDGATVSPREMVRAHFGLESAALPIGLVSEGSTIGKIKFETWAPETCQEGQLIFCMVNGERVFYQIVEGSTREETLAKHRHGFQVAEATQLGVLDQTKGFLKFSWLPTINTPAFLAQEQAFRDLPEPTGDEFVLGMVPGSAVPVIADIHEMRSHHTAMLGVTGTGKTELAFDLIRRAISERIKVVCVDLTGFYEERLADLAPLELGLDSALADELGQRLFEAETGEYGAGKEKQVLKKFADPLRKDVEQTVEGFFEDDDRWVGIFGLPSISNTKATVYATELYLSSVFRYAREHEARLPTWVVLEEAHTLVPEPTTMGLGDYESRGMVAKIAQIALQGRKYDVGLLVIAQRTATVSKTVLTQCNTMIAFSTFDQTGIDFMSNFYGSEYARLAPNLRFLQAVAFGKGIKSERPLIVEIPYDEDKVQRRAESKATPSIREEENGMPRVVECL